MQKSSAIHEILLEHTHIQLTTLVYRIEFSVLNILKLEFVVYRFSVMGTQLSQEYREW